MVQLKQLSNEEEKSNLTNFILRELPEWFGIEASIIDYVNGVKTSDYYVAYDLDKPVGFISIKSNNPFTSEIYVMGILKDYHHQGIGKRLLEIAEVVLQQNKVRFFMVKTLGESHPDVNYIKTRLFYESAGFYPLEEIKEIWGKENPCLIMVKKLDDLHSL